MVQKGEHKTMHCCIFFSSVLQVQKKSKGSETGHLCAVAVQVLFGLMFEFCEGVVYSQCIRLFFKIQSHAFISEKDSLKEYIY